MSARDLIVGDGRILVGSALERLAELAPGSVQAAVTSPPYWGLRRYGDDAAELGREPTVAEYVEHLVAVFAIVRRALDPTGTLWLNMGDAYCRSGGRGGGFGETSAAHAAHRRANGEDPARWAERRNERRALRRYPLREAWDTPEKGLVGLPWRVALALQAAGWVWRATLPWVRRNAMPESVLDRPVAATEYMLMFAASGETYYDADAVRVPAVSHTRAPRNQGQRAIKGRPDDGLKRPAGDYQRHPDGRLWRNSDPFIASLDPDFEGLVLDDDDTPLAVVANVAPSGTSHVAPFTPRLIDPFIRASTRAGDLVLDPFLGSGTTGLVAQRRGRRWVGVELYADVAHAAVERIERDCEASQVKFAWEVA